MASTTDGEYHWPLWQTLLGGTLTLLLGLWIGWTAVGCFTDAGQWWRGRVKDSFIAAEIRPERIHTPRVTVMGIAIGTRTEVEGHYWVAGVEHRLLDTVEIAWGRDHDKAVVRAQEFLKAHPTLAFHYDPANPAYAVISKDHVPGFPQALAMAVLGLLLFAPAFVLTTAGLGNLLLPLVDPTRR